MTRFNTLLSLEKSSCSISLNRKHQIFEAPKDDKFSTYYCKACGDFVVKPKDNHDGKQEAKA